MPDLEDKVIFEEGRSDSCAGVVLDADHIKAMFDKWVVLGEQSGQAQTKELTQNDCAKVRVSEEGKEENTQGVYNPREVRKRARPHWMRDFVMMWHR